MRNNVISICKGIAIILMVLGHTEGPGFLMHIVYLFHMPIFFITAGYTTNVHGSDRYLDIRGEAV